MDCLREAEKHLQLVLEVSAEPAIVLCLLAIGKILLHVAKNGIPRQVTVQDEGNSVKLQSGLLFSHDHFKSKEEEGGDQT